MARARAIYQNVAEDKTDRATLTEDNLHRQQVAEFENGAIYVNDDLALLVTTDEIVSGGFIANLRGGPQVFKRKGRKRLPIRKMLEREMPLQLESSLDFYANKAGLR